MNQLRELTKWSYLSGYLIGAGKIVMAVFSHSWLIFIHAIYSIVKANAQHYARKKGVGDSTTMFSSGLLVIDSKRGVFGVFRVHLPVWKQRVLPHVHRHRHRRRHDL